MGKHTAIAFKNDVPDDGGSSTPKWEIKNLHVKALCSGSTDIENTDSTMPQAIRMIEDGRLIIILPDGSKYDILGRRF